MWIALLLKCFSYNNRHFWFRGFKNEFFYCTFVSSLLEPSSSVQQFECTLCLTSYVVSVNRFRILSQAGPSDRAVEGVGLRPLACWDRGFESQRGHGCLSVVSVVCLSGRGLCVELMTRPEDSYRLWCVVVCDLDTSWIRRPWPTGGCCAKKNILSKSTCNQVRQWLVEKSWGWN